MKKSFIFKILAVVLAMVMGALVLTACSGDDENTDTNTTAADEAQTTQAETEKTTEDPEIAELKNEIRREC